MMSLVVIIATLINVLIAAGSAQKNIKSLMESNIYAMSNMAGVFLDEELSKKSADQVLTPEHLDTAEAFRGRGGTEQTVSLRGGIRHDERIPAIEAVGRNSWP